MVDRCPGFNHQQLSFSANGYDWHRIVNQRIDTDGDPETVSNIRASMEAQRTA